MSTFTVVYNANGATAGSVPVDTKIYSTNPNAPNNAATVVIPASNFVSGADTFARWTSNSDGTGTSYGAWATGTVTSTVAGVVNLYAQWFTVTGLTNNGTTKHYQLQYERSLAGSAFSNLEPGRTNQFLQVIEDDHQQLVTWFGGLDVTGFYKTPIPINIDNLFGGARTGGPGGTLPLPIGMDFFGIGLDYNGLRYLLYSEVSEILMHVQGQGWFDGGDEQSCGEALSRFLAAQFLKSVGITLSNPTYVGYQTSFTWLNSSLPPSVAGSSQLSGPIGQLTSALNATSTSVIITGQFSASFESTYVIQIDNEQMLVTNFVLVGNTEQTLTIQRGYNGTVATAHAALTSGNPTNVFFSYGARSDYVNTTLEYDNGIDASVGCSTLFIYYLNTQLGFTPEQICTSAPGLSNAKTCLRGVYNKLTNDPSDPFPYFKALLDTQFPPDQVSSIPGPNPDNPWPLGSLTFWGVKNTWGKDEVSDILSTGGVYPNAFWLQLEGLNQVVVGSIVPATPTIAFTGATAMPNGGAIYETTNTLVPQHIRFAYDVHFDNSVTFPATGEKTAEVTSELTVLSVPFPAQDDFYFIAGADPYFTNVLPTADPADENAPRLSNDIRVFTATPQLLDPNPTYPVPGGPPFSVASTAAAYQYISELIPYLNSNYGDPNGIDPFAANSGVIQGEAVATNGDSSVTPFTTVLGQKLTNYNFAIARVRLQGTAGSAGEAKNVKVFFRVWQTQTIDTQWNPAYSYLHQLDSSGNILGPEAPPDNYTIPFFATENPDLTDPNNSEYGPTGVNNTTIVVNQGDGQWTYYGCFLDLYDTQLLVNGVAVATLFPGTHHCLVAEINYADAPIQTPTDGSQITPESSSQLAQRNLDVTPGDNPGPPAAHRIPQTFDMVFTPNDAPFNDELMIDWGSVPVGSTASIYWPQLLAADIVQLSTSLYGYHALSAADNNTIQCKTVNGVTYIPIPFIGEESESIASLFTIDLPTGVRAGQEFNVLVRRLRARTLAPSVRPPQIIAKRSKSKFAPIREEPVTPVTPGYSKAVLGSFNVRIPIATAATLLRPESDTLAIFKARLAATPKTSRWWLVLNRYIGYLSGRVNGLGGSASGIPPSFGGAPIVLPEPGPSSGQKECCYWGKVGGICYDGSGFFEGFLLECEGNGKNGSEKEWWGHKEHGGGCGNEEAHEHRFDSRKEKIFKLVEKAWLHGTKISVCVAADKPRVVTTLVLREHVEEGHAHGLGI